MKILTVDDDPSILEVLGAALGSLENCEIVPALSAARGLDILKSDPGGFAAALVDIQMPEMNGIEMCGEIRKLPGYEHMPIIVVTAMSQRNYISDAFRAGATDYVTKPFDLIDLRSRVTSALRQTARNAKQRVTRDHSVADAIPLRNVTRFLGIDEYENYVMQIAQSMTSKSSVVAVKIQHVSKLHAKLSAEAFEDAIETVGAAISVMTRQEGHMISYRGNGVFLCIRIGRYDVLPDNFEPLLNRQIIGTTPKHLADFDLRVCVGETTVLRANSKTAALDSLMRAVRSVDKRADMRTPVPSVSARALSSGTRTLDDERTERRVYSLLLKDVLRDEFSLIRGNRKTL
jgi:CheY-like chemotaxis protein